MFMITRLQGAAPRRDQGADAFDAAFVRLQVALDSACRIERMGAVDPSWPVQAAAAICAGLEWVAVNPEAANVLTNEALAGGSEGVTRYHRLVTHLAELFESGREESSEATHLPPITERALAGGLTSLIAQRIDQGEADALPGLAPEAIQFALTPYVGVERARRTAADAVARD